MGLDNFWKNTDSSAPALDVTLCGGICSEGNGNSFRGKVYNSIIQDITGVSLYQETIQNKTIKEMAAKLEKFLGENQNRIIIDSCGRKMYPEEFSDLVKMFSFHAQYNSDLIGWW